MAERSSETADRTELADDAISRRHKRYVRFERTSVNVENVHQLCSHRRMNSAHPKLASQRLKALCDRAGLAGDRMAKAFGYKTRSGLQNYTDDTDREFFPEHFVRRVASALIGEGHPPITMTDIIRLSGDYADPKDQETADIYANILGLSQTMWAPSQIRENTGPVPVNIPVMGEVHASYWKKRPEHIGVPDEWLSLPFQDDGAAAAMYALRVKGPSMNKVMPEGGYAVILPISAKEKFSQNDIVHVERLRGGEMEWSLKRIKWRDGEPRLFPESHDPDFKEPIPHEEPDTEMGILGSVWCYISFP